MKKLVLVLLSIVLVVVCLTACSKDDNSSGSSEEKKESAAQTAETSLNTASVVKGGEVTFGRYKQKYKSDDGPDAIAWIVLDVQDGKALLLSKYALDVKPYNTEIMDITWEQCTLRSWLNNEFFMTAFNENEQSAILTTHVDNSRAQGNSAWDIDGGNDTEDRIFLLSWHEVFDLYFTSNSDRKCVVTGYALENNAWTVGSDNVNGWPTGAWWLRSPGFTQMNAASVAQNGASSHYYVHCNDYVVRPALWVKLESGN